MDRIYTEVLKAFKYLAIDAANIADTCNKKDIDINEIQVAAEVIQANAMKEHDRFLEVLNAIDKNKSI